MTKEDDEKSRLIRQVSFLTVIPILLAVGPLVGMFIGKLLDEWLGTEPWLMYVLLVMGFVASGREVYQLIKRVSKDQ